MTEKTPASSTPPLFTSSFLRGSWPDIKKTISQELSVQYGVYCKDQEKELREKIENFRKALCGQDNKVSADLTQLGFSHDEAKELLGNRGGRFEALLQKITDCIRGFDKGVIVKPEKDAVVIDLEGPITFRPSSISTQSPALSGALKSPIPTQLPAPSPRREPALNGAMKSPILGSGGSVLQKNDIPGSRPPTPHSSPGEKTVNRMFDQKFGKSSLGSPTAASLPRRPDREPPKTQSNNSTKRKASSPAPVDRGVPRKAPALGDQPTRR